ncbi:MAG: hypothetical protein PVJ21_07600 [Anaerolineales bacterium]|jgi:V/A-type H+-transporting ATPase subunit K
MELGIGIIALSAALAVGITAIGTAIAQARIGSAGIGALVENPDLIGSIILMLAIPETMVVLGFAASAMIILLLGGG